MTNVATIRYDEDSQRYGDGGIKKCATSSQVLAQMPFMNFPLDQIPLVALIGRVFKAVQHMKVRSRLPASEVGRSVEIWVT